MKADEGRGSDVVRVLKAAVPVIALVAMAAGCSSSEGKDEEQLTAQRENYCKQLGAWQKAHSATDAETPDSRGFDEVEALAQDAFLAMRPIRDEAVGGGRTLGEATGAAMNNGDAEAAGLIVQYCGDAGFETLTR